MIPIPTLLAADDFGGILKGGLVVLFLIIAGINWIIQQAKGKQQGTTESSDAERAQRAAELQRQMQEYEQRRAAAVAAARADADRRGPMHGGSTAQTATENERRGPMIAAHGGSAAQTATENERRGPRAAVRPPPPPPRPAPAPRRAPAARPVAVPPPLVTESLGVGAPSDPTGPTGPTGPTFATGPSFAGASPITDAGGKVASGFSIRGRKIDRAAVRQAFIINEIFGKPRGLRDESDG